MKDKEQTAWNRIKDLFVLLFVILLLTPGSFLFFIWAIGKLIMMIVGDHK